MKHHFSYANSAILFLCLEVLFLIFFNENSFGQTSSCYNADFEQNSLAGWTGTTGICCPINSTTPGLVPGRHTIMSGNGTDIYTNNQLKVVAPGGNHSARLGNSNVGNEAEQLKYNFSVDTTNELFIYRYAVVLEDPNHTAAEQPRFEIKVYDQAGLIIPCGSYFVYSTAGIPGFKTSHYNGGLYHWKDWTTIGIDLSSYVGQTVTIEFSTGDCALGGHFGYAYLDCYCSPLNIVSDFCPGNGTTIMVAPPGFANYIWSTGDTTQSITIQNPQIGVNYSVTLVSVTGCQVTLNQAIALTNIIPSFNVQNRCSNAAQFTNASTATHSTPLTNIAWDFGDGTSSADFLPFHVYPSPGTYDVTMTIANQSSCDSSITQPVTILDIPQPDFTNTATCFGKPVYFSDHSISPNSTIATWIWDYGDGSPTSSTPNTSHTYPSQASYNAFLIVTDLNGCTDTITKQIDIQPAPFALISSVDSCSQPSLTFNDASTASGGYISNWLWDFGDNSLNSTLQNPYHVYSSSGNYNVSLIVTSNSGCMDTVNSLITLLPVPDADFSTQGTCINSPISFMDNTPNSPSQIMSWNWNFGDGSPNSLMQNPIYSYGVDATYDVTLVVRNNVGCVDSINKQIIVQPNPVADFVADPVCLNSTTLFEDHSMVKAGDVQNWFWNFNDGATASTSIARHIFTSIGLHTCNLSVYSSYGCFGTISKDVKVYEPPVALMESVSKIGCPPLSVAFIDSSYSNEGSLVDWIWKFSDGTSASGKNITNSFSVPGVHSAKLIVTSEYGCSDIFQTKDIVTVYPWPVANFSFSPSAINVLEPTVQIKDEAVEASHWYYTFGDGEFSDLQNPIHRFPADHSYRVWQFITSPNGCLDSVSKDIDLKEINTLYVPNAFTPNNDKNNDGFRAFGAGIAVYEISIYDRWGLLLFRSNDLEETWDGTYNGSPAMADVYVYKISAVDIYKEQHELVGRVTLIR